MLIGIEMHAHPLTHLFDLSQKNVKIQRMREQYLCTRPFRGKELGPRLALESPFDPPAG